MQNLFTNAEWIGQKLNITQCEWQDGAGSLVARASWGRQSGVVEFQARSTLNLKSFLDAVGFGKLLAATDFSAPPLLDISGTFPFGETKAPTSIIGRIALGGFSYKSVPFSSLTLIFLGRNRTMVRDIRCDKTQANSRLIFSTRLRLPIKSLEHDNPALAMLVPADFRQFVSEGNDARTHHSSRNSRTKSAATNVDR